MDMIGAVDRMLGLIDRWNTTIVTCPECSFEQDLTDTDYAEHYVTVWGEDDPKEYECPECGHKVMVKERVMRSFEIVEDDV
jgi:DNA-directed RNA polymerase subunit RPC12/RpoP